MVSLPVFNENGDQQGDMEVDVSSLGEKPNIELIKQAVVMYQANKRQGTHKTKCRNEIKGSKKKLWKQKGTGRARVGTAKVPHFVGGGHAFALRPRDYSKAMNKKARDTALKSALLAKILGESLVVVDGIDFDKPQTKRAKKMIDNLKISGRCVFASTEVSSPLLLSFRNLDTANIKKVSDLNTLDVMNCKKLIVDKVGLESFLKAGK